MSIGIKEKKEDACCPLTKNENQDNLSNSLPITRIANRQQELQTLFDRKDVIVEKALYLMQHLEEVNPNIRELKKTFSFLHA